MKLNFIFFFFQVIGPENVTPATLNILHLLKSLQHMNKICESKELKRRRMAFYFCLTYLLNNKQKGKKPQSKLNFINLSKRVSI